jgi:hypothetical protein
MNIVLNDLVGKFVGLEPYTSQQVSQPLVDKPLISFWVAKGVIDLKLVCMNINILLIF